MQTFFTFTADFTPWQQQRVEAACKAFAAIIDPGFDAEPLDLDGTRVGWFYHLTSDEARRQLVMFFTVLTGAAADEQRQVDPCIHGRRDAGMALDHASEVV